MRPEVMATESTIGAGDSDLLCPTWLASELTYLSSRANERLEEFAFQVSEDVEWLTNFAQQVQISKDLETTGIELKEPLALEDLPLRSPLKDITNGTLERPLNTSKPSELSDDDTGTANPDSSHLPTSKTADEEPEAVKSKVRTTSMRELSEGRIAPATTTKHGIELERDSSLSSSTSIHDPETSAGRRDIASHETPQSLKKIMLNDKVVPNELETEEVVALKSPSPSRPNREIEAIQAEVSATTRQAAVELSPEHARIERNKPNQEIGAHHANSTKDDNDYMEPINLDSPPKRDHSRADSAYFSAAGSPTAEVPRQSVAFASLPARQPFSKKSMGPRSSQARSSVYEPTKSLSKTPNANEIAVEAIVKPEPQATPQISMYPKLYESPKIKSERLSMQISTVVPQSTNNGFVDAQRIQEQLRSMQPKAKQADRTLPNPFVVNNTLEIEPVEHVKDIPTSSEHAQADDDDWLPKFVAPLNSPRKTTQPNTGSATSQMSKASVEIPASRLPGPQAQKTNQTGNPARRTAQEESAMQIDSTTPGPIRAAMQAASAKATSYLRQARTAFGSPSIQHTKVFHSTTPVSKPANFGAKLEPKTPSLYPDIVTAATSQKPSMIPGKTPKKEYQKPSMTIENSPRRSPRRSPKKGPQAMQSMAVMAARSATVTAQQKPTDRTVSSTLDEQVTEFANSPRKPTKLTSKSLVPSKTAKPLSIRVATASQREIDSTKDRKMQIPVHSQTVITTQNQSVADPAQLDFLSKSQSGTAKRVAPSRQIKALAAANQAKEKADREQERREQQRREIERKRQENARKQADEDERRRMEQMDESNRKRKALAEAKSVSAKKQIRVMTTKSTSRDAPTMASFSETATAKPAHVPMKRILADVEEAVPQQSAVTQDVKRRCTAEQTDRTSVSAPSIAPLASKPIRVSLQQQKKSLFGHPGEPGYKRPGTNAFIKPSAQVEAVKFSNEPIRFASNNNSAASEMTKSHAHLPPSELIELPEINSDYSDSDEEDENENSSSGPQKDAFERPGWAESPELRKLLRRQQRVDPDDIFGPIPPLQMEEIFKGKERALARFRPRSSSANWSGNDKLTAEEVTEYAKVMGFR